MPPPRKRPRLHFIGSSSPEPDVELATARSQNDNLLKTRWESVFQRYERDFTGVGDEIGIISGEVEVDNGHLRSMQNEKDIGESPPASPSKFDGRRMLRAMTVAPTDYLESISDADEVLQSIETIADNALLSDYCSEDDLFDAHSNAGGEVDDELSQNYHTEQYHDQDGAPGSPDDLFDNRPLMRSPSVDSLFASRSQDETPTTAKEASLVPDLDPGTSVTPEVQSQHRTETTIREQVRRILQEEKEQEKKLEEEKIEPAWRLPVRLPSLSHSWPASASLPRIASTNRSPAEADDELDIDQQMSTSIWNTLARTRRSRREMAAERSLKRIRAESEDPLQEGFSSESEESARQSTVGGSSLPSSRQATVEYPSQPLSRRSLTRPSTQPPSSPEVATKHGYSTRHALRRRSFRHQRRRSSLLQDAAQSSAQHTPFATGATPESVTSGALLAHQETGRQGKTRRPPLSAAAENCNGENQMQHGLCETEDLLMPRPSSPDILIAAAKEEAVAEQTEDTIVVNQIRHLDDASDRQSNRRRRNAPRTPRACHPWEIGKSRSGNPMTNLSKSLRRSAGQKYKEGLSNATSATKLALPDGSTIATFAEIEKLDAVLAEMERQKILKPMRNGLCIYCNANYQDVHTTGSHWDRVLTNFVAGALDDDDPHDMEFIHSIRSKIERRIRAPQTLLRDFRLIVELHEGRGLTFQQIYDSKLLHTGKHPSKLKKEYPTYRQVPAADATDHWTKELEERLWQEVEKADDNATMVSLRRQLVGHNIEEVSMLDLGNKLADKFLEEYLLRDDAVSDQLQMFVGAHVQPSHGPEFGHRQVHGYVNGGRQRDRIPGAEQAQEEVGAALDLYSRT